VKTTPNTLYNNSGGVYNGQYDVLKLTIKAL
jgi:hypothetical protein